MKRIAFWLLVLLAASGWMIAGCGRTPGVRPPIEVYSLPQGGCTEAVVAEIRDAQSSILVQT